MTIPPAAMDGRTDALWAQTQRAVRQAAYSRTSTVSITLTLSDGLVLMVADGAPLTATLPPARESQGAKFMVKKWDVSANAVTVAATGPDTIDGSGSYVLTIPYQSVTVAAVPGGWAIC